MADQQQQHAPGGHYSGRNRIPNIKEFVENLDRDKKDRDKKIDEQKKQSGKPQGQGDIHEHVEQKTGGEGTEKTVTDPTTGREVTIDNVGPETMERVKNPMVSQSGAVR